MNYRASILSLLMVTYGCCMGNPYDRELHYFAGMEYPHGIHSRDLIQKYGQDVFKLIVIIDTCDLKIKTTLKRYALHKDKKASILLLQRKFQDYRSQILTLHKNQGMNITTLESLEDDVLEVKGELSGIINKINSLTCSMDGQRGFELKDMKRNSKKDD